MADVREPPVERPSGDVATRTILAIAAAWIVFICAALAILAGVYYWVAPPGPPPVASKFPLPQLITEPSREYEHLVGAEKRELESYGWIDRKQGLAHIPIERAMAAELVRPDPYSPISGTSR